jgi:hypothetical protein
MPLPMPRLAPVTTPRQQDMSRNGKKWMFGDKNDDIMGIHMVTFMVICMYVYIHTIYIYTIYIDTYMHIYIYIHIHMYVYIYGFALWDGWPQIIYHVLTLAHVKKWFTLLRVIPIMAF